MSSRVLLVCGTCSTLSVLAAAAFSQRASELGRAARVPSRVDPLVLSAGCEPQWLPTFGLPGVNGPVEALEVYDDGRGPALYVAGSFTAVDGVLANSIARWDGAHWEALGSGIGGPGADPTVYALQTHDDGSGPALFAAGSFTSAGGVPVGRIAKWDGVEWTSVGGGMNNPVQTLTVFDDGSGAALYAGGSFTTAGGLPHMGRVAKWDGSTWSPLGNGISGTGATVLALAVFDDGSGTALYAGGTFAQAGGAAASSIAKWTGVGWTSLGAGVDGEVRALTVHDLGTGPVLCAGGAFASAGGLPADGIARWDGSSWAALGGGLNPVEALGVFDPGSGPALHAGGDFSSSNHLARWDGSSWVPLDGGADGVVLALESYDDGGGPALFAGGDFAVAGGVAGVRIASWDGAGFAKLSRRNGPNAAVSELAVFDDGSGPALYAGGTFAAAGPEAASRVARWNGASWAPLGTGVDGNVRALAVHDDGGGPALYAGGDFTSAGGVTANRIARWDGSSWSAVGSGMDDGAVFALAVFDDGGGPALYAGGTFSSAGGVTVNRIAKWDGASWTPLGLGVRTVCCGGPPGGVYAMTGVDDGSGPALYVGGDFDFAGGISALNMARWDGSSWSPLGGGLGNSHNDAIHALQVFDDGSGPALFAAGPFYSGGFGERYIQRWSGTSWSDVGSGVGGPVVALTVYDQGDGPALYAGGAFETAGGLAANRVARWDGTSWTPLAEGVGSGVAWYGNYVLALHVFDDGNGPGLYAGGNFVDFSRDSHLARWQCPLIDIDHKTRVR